MSIYPRLLALFLVLGLLGAAALVGSSPAQGESPAREALLKAIARGKELYAQRWGPESQACTECHTAPQNRMRAARLKSYPKYDLALLKVISGQQKLNHMIETKSRGTALPLGSDDLNALEAYIGTLR